MWRPVLGILFFLCGKKSNTAIIFQRLGKMLEKHELLSLDVVVIGNPLWNGWMTTTPDSCRYQSASFSLRQPMLPSPVWTRLVFKSVAGYTYNCSENRTEHCCVSKHVHTHSRQPLLIFRWRIPKSKYIIILATLGVSGFNKDNVFALVINKNHYYQHRSVVCINNQYQNGRDYVEQDQPCTPCGLVYKTIPPSQNYITSNFSNFRVII